MLQGAKTIVHYCEGNDVKRIELNSGIAHISFAYEADNQEQAVHWRG